MGGDAELEQLRAGVSCATVLEKRGWKLDRQESTRRCLKYRRGEGEILIINHDGRGWWDPTTGNAKGDVFSLVQHLDPGLNFGHVRRVLRELVGIAASYPELGRRGRKAPEIPFTDRWRWRSKLTEGSPTWRYLHGTRAIPAFILHAASEADAIREGPYGSAWFAHRDGAGRLTGFEMRGPGFRGFSRGGDKTLFRLSERPGRPPRLAVVEAPIDALSLAALERLRPDTLYVATTGGMGPSTVGALQELLTELASLPEGILIAATDADRAGERYAARLAELAEAAGVGRERLIPPDRMNDWNDVLTRTSGKGQDEISLFARAFRNHHS